MKKIITRKRCPECGVGELSLVSSWTGNGLLPKNCTCYPHNCNNCFCTTEVLGEIFPKTHFEFEEHEIKEVWE